MDSASRELNEHNHGPSPVDECIPLNITGDYAPLWKEWEGVREFVQNWHDGLLSTLESHQAGRDVNVCFQKEENKEGIVEYKACIPASSGETCVLGRLFYDPDNKSVTMVNRRTCLEKTVFLLGHSKKPSRPEVIGQFGEGLKLGSLALVRAGCRVVMCTGEERWHFDLTDQLQHSFLKGKNQTKVLAVHVRKRRPMPSCDVDLEQMQPPCPVQVSSAETSTQIWPIAREEWQRYSKRFLFLEEPQKAVTTEQGCLVLDTAMAGSIFVKRVWVKNLEDMKGAIDLKNISLDRDRQACVDMAQLEHTLSAVWVHAVNKDLTLAEQYCRLLHDRKSREVVHAETYILRHAETAMCKAVATAFFRLKGDGHPLLLTTSPTDIHRIRQSLNEGKVHLVSGALYTVLKKAGRVPVLQAQPQPQALPTPAPAPPSSCQPSPEQQVVIDQAFVFVKSFIPNFPFDRICYYDVMYGEVMAAGQEIRVPTWLLSPPHLHQRLSSFNCPAPSLDKCCCAVSYLASSLLLLDPHHSHPGRTSDLLLRILSGLAQKVHSYSEEKSLPSSVGNGKHHHLAFMESRRVEIQEYIDGLKEEQERKRVEFQRAKEQLHGQVDELAQQQLEASRSTESEGGVDQRRQEVQEDLAKKYKNVCSGLFGEMESASSSEVNLRKDVAAAEDKLQADSDSLVKERQQYDLDLRQRAKTVTDLVQRIASLFTAQQALVGEGSTLELQKDSPIFQNLEALKSEIDDLMKSGKCFTCKSTRFGAVAWPCKHLMLCYACCKDLHTCPCCHKRIEHFEQLYVT